MQKQKIRGMVLAAVVCCVSLSGCGAAEKTAQQTDLPNIIIGSDNYPPYNYENVDGKPTGIDVDLATEAFRRMGYQAVFTYIDWEKKKCWSQGRLTASGAAFPSMGARRNTVGVRPI